MVGRPAPRGSRTTIAADGMPALPLLSMGVGIWAGWRPPLMPHIDGGALAMGDTMRTFARTAAPPARHAEQPLPSALCLRQVFRPVRVDRPQRAYERGPLFAGLRPGLRRGL